MTRSAKKGPYTDSKLMKKIVKAKDENKTRDPIKTWARESTITPDMINFIFKVHDGRKFIEVKVSEAMVGHKLGEFALTRTFRAHSGQRKTAGKAAGKTEK